MNEDENLDGWDKFIVLAIGILSLFVSIGLISFAAGYAWRIFQ